MFDIHKIRYDEVSELILRPDLCVINDLGSFASKGQTDLPNLPETGPAVPVRIIIDQIIPANDPSVSDGQRELMAAAKKYHLPYTYGSGMTSQVLAADKITPGTVIVGTNPELSMCGGSGAAGLCLPETDLVQILREGTPVRRRVRGRELLLTGTCPTGVTVRDAAYAICAVLGRQDPETILIVRGEGLDAMSAQDRQILCGILGHTGALFALAAEKEAQCSADPILFDLYGMVPMAVQDGDMTGAVSVDRLRKREIRVVYIGGAYGGTLEEIRVTAQAVAGKKIADRVRLLAAPADTDIWVQAANLGYLDQIMAAGGMVLNQCASPDVQGRIGSGEWMVSNDIRGEKGFAGQQAAGILLTSAQTAATAALNGKIGR